MQTNHTTQKKIISHYNNKQLDELYKEISEFIQLTQTCISLSINPTDGRQLMKKCSYYEYTLTNVNKVCADRNYYRKFQNLISTSSGDQYAILFRNFSIFFCASSYSLLFLIILYICKIISIGLLCDIKLSIYINK